MSQPKTFLQPSQHSACPWFRKTFDLQSEPSDTLVYVGSIGFHELYINGQRVGEDVLSPSISDLAKRVLIRTYNVTQLLKPGQPNTIGLWLAPGWAMFDSVNPAKADMFNVSSYPLALVELHVLSRSPTRQMVHDNTDGAVVTSEEAVVVSDSSWLASESDTVHLGKWTNSNFGGDRVDGRKTIAGNGWAITGGLY
jgi:alpha-L-rhamnosidase